MPGFCYIIRSAFEMINLVPWQCNDGHSRFYIHLSGKENYLLIFKTPVHVKDAELIA